MNTLIVFGEGPTEKRLMERLLPHAAPGWGQLDFRESGGKAAFVDTIVDYLGEKLSRPELLNPVYCLFLADQDAGETDQSIQQRHTGGLRRLFVERAYPAEEIAFGPVAGHDNVALVSRKLPPGLDFRVALHIARAPASLTTSGLTFANASTDDYILAVALADEVTSRFAAEAGLSADALSRKVVAEIPDQLRANDLKGLEAKDLIAIYMAVGRFLKVKRTGGKERFADIALQRALKYAQPMLDTIFASLIAAIRAAIAQENVP
jgi:hypothetical protein